MNTLLQSDFASRPDLFHFIGPISTSELDTWLSGHEFTVPDDLKECWRDTGGGDLFETETILSPFGPVHLADDVQTVNDLHWQKGMPVDWLIFHTGLGGLSVVQMGSGTYVSVREESYEVQGGVASFHDWYANLIRREYSSRYNLAHP